MTHYNLQAHGTPSYVSMAANKTEHSVSSEAHSTLSYSNSAPFMEPQCSLPCSQKATTGPHRQAHESIPHPPTLFP
jgi:hypothetical protein